MSFLKLNKMILQNATFYKVKEFSSANQITVNKYSDWMSTNGSTLPTNFGQKCASVTDISGFDAH